MTSKPGRFNAATEMERIRDNAVRAQAERLVSQGDPRSIVHELVRAASEASRLKNDLASANELNDGLRRMLSTATNAALSARAVAHERQLVIDWRDAEIKRLTAEVDRLTALLPEKEADTLLVNGVPFKGDSGALLRAFPTVRDGVIIED